MRRRHRLTPESARQAEITGGRSARDRVPMLPHVRYICMSKCSSAVDFFSCITRYDYFLYHSQPQHMVVGFCGSITCVRVERSRIGRVATLKTPSVYDMATTGIQSLFPSLGLSFGVFYYCLCWPSRGGLVPSSPSGQGW